MLTEIFEGERQPIADLVAHAATDVDPVRFR